MANTPSDNIITRTPEETSKVEKQGYMQSYPGTREGQKEGKFPFPAGHLVKDRTARVSAKAPAKMETTSSPSGNLFEADKSENYGIRDVAPMDRK